jgi:hypothetical protein
MRPRKRKQVNSRPSKNCEGCRKRKVMVCLQVLLYASCTDIIPSVMKENLIVNYVFEEKSSVFIEITFRFGFMMRRSRLLSAAGRKEMSQYLGVGRMR